MNEIYDFEQPARLWLAELIDNLDTLKKSGNEPSMDLTIHGVTFEFRVKPETLKEPI